MVRNDKSKRISLFFSGLRVHHLGFAFIWASSLLMHRDSMLLGNDLLTNESLIVLLFASFAANIATLFFISSRIEQNSHFFDMLKPGIFVAIILLGFCIITTANVLAAKQTLSVGALFGLIIGGASLTGCGYGYFWGSWAQYYGRINPSRSLTYLPLILLLSSFLYVSLSLLNKLTGVPALLLMIPLPFLSYFCLKKALQETPNPPIHPQEENYRSAMGSLLVLIPSGIVLSFLFGLMWQMAVGETESSQSAHLVPMIANVVIAIALLVFMIFSYRKLESKVVFHLLIPITIVLFLLVPFFWEANSLVIYTIMSATHGVLDLVIWFMVVATAYEYAVSGFVVGSLVRGITLAARLAGIGLGYVLTLINDSFPLLLIGISVTAIYLLIIIIFFQNSRFKFSFSGVSYAEEAKSASQATTHPKFQNGQTISTPPANNSATSSTSKPTVQVNTANLWNSKLNSASPLNNEESSNLLEKIADDYGFTRREREVFAYLAKGRSAKVIAEALVVSENTIRTHTRKILEKTDLHSKQDLIDLIDSYDAR